MSHLLPERLPLCATALILCIIWGLIGACTSSRTPEEVAADRATVLGLWKYRADGTDALQRGTLQIHVKDGQLKGRIQDRWRGTKEVDVFVENGHMDVTLNQVRISGRLYGGRFEGAIRNELWDASKSGSRRSGSGAFVAKRIRRASTADRDLGCPSLLREQSYACSPLPGRNR